MPRALSTYRAQAAAVLTTACVVLLGSAISAALLSQQQFHDTYTGPSHDSCMGMDARGNPGVHENDLVRTNVNKESDYFKLRVHGSTTDTNLTTGKSYRNTFTFYDKGHRVTDHGDGTVTIRATGTGVNRYFGPDGEFLFVDAGMTQFELDVHLHARPSGSLGRQVHRSSLTC